MGLTSAAELLRAGQIREEPRMVRFAVAALGREEIAFPLAVGAKTNSLACLSGAHDWPVAGIRLSVLEALSAALAGESTGLIQLTPERPAAESLPARQINIWSDGTILGIVDLSHNVRLVSIAL